MKYLFSFLFFFILILSCKRDNDSIYSKNKLDNHLEEVYNSSLAKEKKLEHLDSAVNIVSKLKDNDSLKIKNTFKIANRYYTLLEYKKYYQTSKKALELSIKQHDTLNIAKSEYYIGDYFFFTSKNDSAYYYYLKAEKKYNKLNDEFNLAKTLLHIAYVLLYERDYLGSEAQTIKVLNIAHEHDTCGSTPYDLVKNYSNKNLITVTGGEGSGEVCGRSHRHSFAGRQKAVSYAIIRWINTGEVQTFITNEVD